MRKTLWTLNIGNYAPEITKMTYPLFERFATKIGADFRQITDRVFPDMPVVYEKFQIGQQGRSNDWNIFIDSDAIIHPDCPDPTEYLSKDTVMCYATDFGPSRWGYDRHFRRDGRHIGWGNWFSISSDWTIDLWEPLDIPMGEALKQISVYVCEEKRFSKEHLIDDFTVSRNVAKFGLKFKSFQTMLKETGQEKNHFLWHNHLIDRKTKASSIREQINLWKLA